jgi:hypothetical protein
MMWRWPYSGHRRIKFTLAVGFFGKAHCSRSISAQHATRSNRKSHGRDILPGSLLKQFVNGALEPVAELFQRIERDVLFTQFKSMQCRIRDACFARELLKSEVSTPFSEERGQLFRQSLLSHATNLASGEIPQVGYFA